MSICFMAVKNEDNQSQIKTNTQHGISQIFFPLQQKSTQTVIRRPRDLNPGPAEGMPSNSPLHHDPLLCLA